MFSTRTVGAILLCCLMAWPAHAINPHSKIITIAADEWCPINCSPNGPQLGIGIDLAKKTLEPLGYTIKYIIMPWKQALEDVRAGKVDAVVGANKQDDPSLIFPDSSIYSISDDFYVLPGSPWRYQGAHTLKGKTIGIIEDYGYGDIITQFINQNKGSRLVKTASGTEALKENIAKLISGDINILIESKPVMDYTLHKTGQTGNIIWAGGVAQDKIYIAFSPTKPGAKIIAEQYDAATRRLRENGSLDAMYAAYGLKP